jgi:hypothetical protein
LKLKPLNTLLITMKLKKKEFLIRKTFAKFLWTEVFWRKKSKSFSRT